MGVNQKHTKSIPKNHSLSPRQKHQKRCGARAGQWARYVTRALDKSRTKAGQKQDASKQAMPLPQAAEALSRKGCGAIPGAHAC
jgi:hypothetical protein